MCTFLVKPFILGAIGKKILDVWIAGEENGTLATDVVNKNDWALITDPLIISAAIDRVFTKNGEEVKKIVKNPKPSRVEFLAGLVLKDLQMKVSPKKVSDAVKEKIASMKSL